MIKQNKSIYAPNIHLFAFQYCQGLEGDFEPFQLKREWIETKYKEILKEFPALNQPFTLRTDTPNTNEFNLLEENEQPYLVFKEIDDRTQEIIRKALIYPQQISKTYALTLDIYRHQDPGKDEVNIYELEDFNPNHCFDIQTDLGKTILITCFLDCENENLEEIARECLSSFLYLSSAEEFPLFYRQGQLFNSPIFEYGNPRASQPDGHFLILFYSSDNSSEEFNKCYLELPSLFLFYHKIIKAFSDSREDYKEVDSLFNQITDTINNIKKKLPVNNSSQKDKVKAKRNRSIQILKQNELEKLKETLKQLLSISLDYSIGLRKLEFHLNSIAINTHNYKTKINQLEVISNSKLGFLQSFAEEECQVFQEQIKGNLNYLHQGTILLEQAIDSIRGLVEIDQAKRDRQLQDLIFAVGTGIGAGGIVAASYGLIVEKPSLSVPEINLQVGYFYLPHPFVMSVALSISLGVAIGFVIYLLLKLTRNKILRLIFFAIVVVLIALFIIVYR